MSDTSPLQLLQVCDLAKQWPNLRALRDLAMDELNKRAEAKAKADAEVAAEAAAEAKALADKQAAADAAVKPKSVPATTYAPAEPRRE